MKKNILLSLIALTSFSLYGAEGGEPQLAEKLRNEAKSKIAQVIAAMDRNYNSLGIKLETAPIDDKVTIVKERSAIHIHMTQLRSALSCLELADESEKRTQDIKCMFKVPKRLELNPNIPK